jgi:hypothetical protein
MPGTQPETGGAADGRSAASGSAAPGSAWAPFRHRWFAAMWSAQFASNVGSWMQTVGAQWLMLTLTSSATYVALVQTASSLPVVLFAVLAGTAGSRGPAWDIMEGTPGKLASTREAGWLVRTPG